jgi:hypothetical protein
VPTDAEAAAVDAASTALDSKALLQQIAATTPPDLLAAIAAVQTAIAQRGLPPNRPGDGAAAPSFAAICLLISEGPSIASQSTSSSTYDTPASGHRAAQLHELYDTVHGRREPLTGLS